MNISTIPVNLLKYTLELQTSDNFWLEQNIDIK